MFFWNSPAFPMIQWMLVIWSLVPLPFLNPAWTSGSSWFTLKPRLENFEHYFASVWDKCNCAVVWTFFDIPFLWDWNENWPDFGIDYKVMSMCTVIFSVVGRGCLLWPVHSLGKTLLPLLSFPNLMAYSLQYFNSTIF